MQKGDGKTKNCLFKGRYSLRLSDRSSTNNNNNNIKKGGVCDDLRGGVKRAILTARSVQI